MESKLQHQESWDWENEYQPEMGHLGAHTGMWHAKAGDGRPDVSRISEQGCFVIGCSDPFQKDLYLTSVSTVVSEDASIHSSYKPCPRVRCYGSLETRRCLIHLEGE